MINFYTEEINFRTPDREELSIWITATIEQEGKMLKALSYIFCSDKYLLQINQEYLQHDSLTDIISFSYSKEAIEGDIFISIDRVKENAKLFQTSFDKELHRVMIHGVLHLIGYGDKTPEEKKIMTDKEEEYLAKL